MRVHAECIFMTNIFMLIYLLLLIKIIFTLYFTWTIYFCQWRQDKFAIIKVEKNIKLFHFHMFYSKPAVGDLEWFGSLTKTARIEFVWPFKCKRYSNARQQEHMHTSFSKNEILEREDFISYTSPLANMLCNFKSMWMRSEKYQKNIQNQ